ncbi:hypothetical protein BST95_11685 [Halioglobus japonicus]|uniref:SRPBCC domain-containing protein n=1 Tax=Halioglobus japonicus TaxID=930805 RepID=A0AAP8MFH2_9GAMM|nr:SRPBCC domain-containing protein [Halioglobus japonicus]AQA18801.1 hypothetical protein BST95_11685 [Halioglobus japonicus]PLW86832.1 SRPBCC domain-containing protein [Halioglobus japonicus]GHD23816.1 hypothetical protein GCM10007052_36920 [Halioglobus japonicus]
MSEQIVVSSDTFTIEAPAALVWQVVVDFANYGEWNAFCPSMEAELVLGAPVVMKVDLGFGLSDQVEYMSCIEAPHRIAWAMENKPGDPIHAERWQVIEPIDDNRCTYVSYDEFTGPEVQGMVEMMGEAVRKGFNICGEGLKGRAEQLYREGNES